MEIASANNPTPPTSGDEMAKFTAYSSAVHKVVVMVNAGLLQLVSQKFSVIETHKAAFICYCVFVLLYAVLRVREAIDVPLRPELVPRLVGHASHLFGSLAALVLLSVLCAAFAIVLLILWCIWLSAITLNEIMIYLQASKSSTSLPV